MGVYEKLKTLGLELPAPSPRGGLYAPVRQAGTMLYVSGQGPTEGGKPLFTGKLGREISIEQGQAAARRCVLNGLAALHEYLGDLDKIAGVVKVLGFVASAPGFNSQPMVINGGSQLLIDLFGEKGWHARSAIGTNELPGDIPVEIEFIFELG
jgi:enamine deaminase RidA (YjgF/YER057c/UK114 family)